MTLCLYNNYNQENIENIFAWVPDEPQWWITGFNPKFPDPNYRIMTLVGSIDFSSKQQMYSDLKSAVNDNDDVNNMFFDDNNHTVWIIW